MMSVRRGFGRRPSSPNRGSAKRARAPGGAKEREKEGEEEREEECQECEEE